MTAIGHCSKRECLDCVRDAFGGAVCVKVVNTCDRLAVPIAEKSCPNKTGRNDYEHRRGKKGAFG